MPPPHTHTLVWVSARASVYLLLMVRVSRRVNKGMPVKS